MKGSRAIIWLAVAAWTCFDTAWAQTRSKVDALALFAAIQRNDLDFAKRHMADFADLNAVDLHGNTLIHALIAPGTIELARKDRLKTATDGPKIVSKKKGDGSNRLETKSTINLDLRLKAIAWLVRHGVPVNARNSAEETPLHLAVKPEIRNAILPFIKIKVSEDLWEYELEPRQTQNLIEFLLKLGADPRLRDNEGNTPLLLASFDLLPLLISHGADVNDQNNDGLTVFLKQTFAREYIPPRLRIDAHGVFSINREQWYSQTRLDWKKPAERLLALGVDVNQKNTDGCSALVRFISKGYTKQVLFLIEHGADVNVTDKNGTTMLHEAVLKRDLPLMELLLQKGAAVNARTRDGDTPLLFASGFKAGAELLFRYHADPRVLTMRSENILHLLVDSQDPRSLEMLSLCIRHGAPLNQKNSSGHTPLSVAFNQRKARAMELLLEAGADPSISGHPGFSLLDQAENEGRSDIITLLRKHGAKQKVPWTTRHKVLLFYGFIGLGVFPLFTFLFSLYKLSPFTKKLAWFFIAPVGCWLLMFVMMISKSAISGLEQLLPIILTMPPLAALLMALSGTRMLVDRCPALPGIILSVLNAVGCFGLTLGIVLAYFPGTKGEGGILLAVDALFGGGAAAVITLVFAFFAWKKRLSPALDANPESQPLPPRGER